MSIPPEVAQYFKNGRQKITSVQANDDFTLTIAFENGVRKRFDMGETLQGEAFKPLRELSEFKRAYVDENGNVAWDKDPAIDSAKVWSNKIDISADNCYIYGEPLNRPIAKSIDAIRKARGMYSDGKLSVEKFLDERREEEGLDAEISAEVVK